MSSSVRTMLFNPRPLRSLVATRRPRRAYATIPTKKPTPSPPKEDSNEQAMPIGRFYEAILNTPRPIPDAKPEGPASSVTAAQDEQAPKESAKRGRKHKAKTEPAATATAGSAPMASPAANMVETAKEVTAKTSPPSLSSSSSSPPPSISTSPPVRTPPPAQSGAEDKAKLVFSSPLVGPAERAKQLAKLREMGTVIAGVMVPPKPEEPDNCCMSGCVNCVWDRYRDEMEDWALADAEAKRSLAAERAARAGVGAGSPRWPPTTSGTDHTAVSMDDDGGGSDTNWGISSAPSSPKIAKDFWDDDLYKNVPVGIREFMKQEKRLKEKHAREGTSWVDTNKHANT